jgi:zinc protease
MRRMIVSASTALLVLLATAPVAATTGATDTVLDNGLRVVLLPHHANPMVASAVVVGAGVVNEGPEFHGASHFLEHLLFNGTTTRTQKQLYDDVDRLGAYNNATTREDHTLFTLLVAKEAAEEGLAIQADMLFRSTIPAANFDKERKIVLEELARDRSDPDYDAEAAFRAFAFSGTPIAAPVLGTEASLAGITRDAVVSYYRARYVPAGMTLVVMGDFEPDAMMAIVGRTFGTAPKRPNPAGRRGSWPAKPKDNLATARATGGSGRVLAAFPVDLDPWDPRAAAVAILLDAAADGEDSPLKEALTRRGIKAEDTTLTLERRVRPWSTVTFDARVPGGADPAAVLDALAEALYATRPGGTARSRLDRYVAAATADAALARDQILYYPMLRSSMILGSPVGFLEAEPGVPATLGPLDWDRASALLSSGLSTLRARATGPAQSDGAIAWTPPAPPPPAEAERRASGTLANGLRYVVTESGDSDVVAVHFAFKPRSAAEPPGKDGLTDLLHRTMTRATIVHDRAALEERLQLLGAHLKAFDDPDIPYDDYYTNSEFSWLRLEAPSRSWREALALVAEMIRFPDIDQEGIDDARTTMLRLVDKRDASPSKVAAAALDGLLAPNSPLDRPVLGTRSTLAAIDRDDLLRYRQGFATGHRMIVTVVGPVPPPAVVEALEGAFGPLPAGDAPAASPAPAPAETPGRLEVALGKKQSSIAMGAIVPVTAADRAPLAVAVAMLSDRLAFDLRETRGLAYAIDTTVRRFGGVWRWDVAMGTRPDNVDTAVAGLVDGIRAFRDADIGTDDVARTVNAARGRALMRRMTRIGLAYEAAVEVLANEAPGEERRVLDAMRSVTADDVRRVARAYLDPDRLSRVVVR